MIHAFMRLLLCATLITSASTALAGGPEQLEQLEPESGEWQVEIHGQFAGSQDEGGEHSLELFWGLSDLLALGMEVEAGREGDSLALEEVGAMVLVRFNDAQEDLVGTGLMLSAAVAADGAISEIEGRAIVEKIAQDWWVQANLIWRRLHEDGQTGERLAYGWSVSRAIMQGLWVGLEGSGRIAASGFAGAVEPDHHAGLATSLELEIGGREIELGAAHLRNLRRGLPASTSKAFVQFGF